MNKVTKCIIAGVAIVAAAGSILGMSMLPKSVAVEKVESLEIEKNLSGKGLIEADAPITIYAPVSGKLSTVLFSVDDKIQSDDLLASYDLADAQKRYDKAGISLAYYEDGYNAAVQSNDDNKKKVKDAKSKNDTLNSQYAQIVNDLDELEISSNKETNENEKTAKIIENELNALKNNLETESANLSDQSSNYEDNRQKMDAVGNDISDLTSKIDNSKDLIQTYKDELAKYSEDSSEYASYKILLENEKNNLSALKDEKSLKKDEYDSLKNEVDRAYQNKESLENTVEEIKNDINIKNDELTSASKDSESDQQYEKYVKLSRQLDAVNKEWDATLDQQLSAEDKIISDTQLKQYEDSLNLAKTEEEIAASDLELAKKGVKSSVKGTIIERMVDKGAVIEEGTPLFVVQPDSGYKASLLVSSDSIDRVEIGQKAKVKLGEKSFEGKVSNIGQIATVDEDGEPKVKVDIALDGSKVTPTIGLEAQVEIFSKIKKSIIQIPSGCLHSDAEGDFVYVLDKGIAAKQHVITGDTSDGYIQITDGLNPGDQVIKSDIGEENVGKVYRVSN